MQSETLGFDKGSARREALVMGLGLWVVGFGLAAASAWQMNFASRGLIRASQTETLAWVPAAPSAAPGTVCDVAATDTQRTVAAVTPNAAVQAECRAQVAEDAWDTPEPQGEMGMPEDIIVGHRESNMGSTQMQK